MNSLTDKSKYLSYILRHKPEAIGLKLDKDGWALIDEIISKSTKSPITYTEILQIVAEDVKGRYGLHGTTHIRANQGHSTSTVNLSFNAGVPPVKLFHGADESALSQIFKEGLRPMSRQYVHLSADVATAQAVGGRRRRGFVVLEIDTKAALADGLKFLVSDNGVWLIKHVPPKYLKEQS